MSYLFSFRIASTTVHRADEIEIKLIDLTSSTQMALRVTPEKDSRLNILMDPIQVLLKEHLNYKLEIRLNPKSESNQSEQVSRSISEIYSSGKTVFHEQLVLEDTQLFYNLEFELVSYVIFFSNY